MNDLCKEIQAEIKAIRKHSPDLLEIPDYVSSNLKYGFYDWQREAFESLLYYENETSGYKRFPTHLMFNMATGSGKTLLMAAVMLYYFKQGYRHFIFFVNRNNIVDKTENNFIDTTHSKYLFTDKIVIDDKLVSIEKVDNFSDNPEGIEIKFTTIQKLYNDIHIEKENDVTLGDLNKKDIVMLADEAHHLNTDTKNKVMQLNLSAEITGKTGKEEVERKGWEHTVIQLILNKNAENNTSNKNVLLEFTATIPEVNAVAKKYEDKTIYKFGLKEFLSAGYTKEINLISSTFDKKERILQALLFHWYRHKIALKNGISNFKPVILFRSRNIEESWADYEAFLKIIMELQSSDFIFLNFIEEKINQSNSIHEQGKSRTKDVLEFIKKEGISYADLVLFMQYSFEKRNCIITNSKTNKTKTEKTDEEQEALLNSLEDKENNVRAIFTVERLTEGWDVLNLYDIVRLYQGQNTGGNTSKTPEATIKEKQLIGRGVRYYPFPYKDEPVNKRKFDNRMESELRILEELFYYTYDEESRYISHLKEELRKEGYINDGKVIKTFQIKPEFKEKDFYRNVKLWCNKRKPNPDRKKKTLEDLDKNFFPSYKVRGVVYSEGMFKAKPEEETSRLEISEQNGKTIRKRISEFDKHILMKALNIKAATHNSMYQFNRLKKELDINCIDDLLKPHYLGDFIINMVVNPTQTYEDISNEEKLNILLDFLDIFAETFKEYINPNIGDKDFIASALDSVFGEAKKKSVVINSESETFESELITAEWYVLDAFHGTNEEIELIRFIKGTIGNLKERYKEVYLLRNEEKYKIYDFDKGRGFQPDFILFLKDKGKHLYYQIFIEPKGEVFIEKDNWKDKFLKDITKLFGEENVLKYEDKEFILIGLPLYNKDDKVEFEEEYNRLI